MKPYIFILLLIVGVYSNKIFLFGSILKNDNNKAYQKIIEVVGKPTRKDCNKNWKTTDCPKVAVITSACSDSKCGQDQYNIGDEQQPATGPFFQSLGMVPQHVSVHIDNYQADTDVLTYQGEVNYYIIARADIIYFNGGDQSRHVRCWFNDNKYPNTISALIKRRVQLNDVVIIGVSAGTAFQSLITYGGGSSFGHLYFSQTVGLAPNKIGQQLQDQRNGTDCLQYDQNGAKMQGFGLIKQFQVDTHFDARGRLGRLIPAMLGMKMNFGVGIDELACIYYEDGVITVYGANGVFITDLSSALNFSDKYLKIKNIKLHYLTQGDRFNFNQKTFQTTKQLISKPSYIGYLDSPDILSQYQTTKLILRLIDQTGTVNEGETKIPQDQQYPLTTPKYSFTFYKDSNTKGYQKGNLKSAFNVYLDISAQKRLTTHRYQMK